MKRYLLTGIVLALFVFLAGGFLFAKRPVPTRNSYQNPIGLRQYLNLRYGLSFSYPEIYVLHETNAPGSGMREHHVITLMRKVDLPPPVGGEGPPSITIDIYQNNLDKQTTESWIRNASASNFKLSEGRLASATVSGLSALSYRWSGLYEGTTVVTAEPDWIYAFTVTYLEMGSQIIQDFVAIRESAKISD